MEPKEKAKELVDKLKIPLILSDTDAGQEIICTDIAKQCALIAVDEVINEYESKICNSGYDYDFERWDMQRDYWIEVKQELEKL